MITLIVLSTSLILLTGCSESTDEPIPHNRVSLNNETLDSVSFSFNGTNRFNKTDFELGIPTLQLKNESYLPLETDFELTVDYYDEGWQEFETINYYVKEYAYTLDNEDRLEYSLFSDHFDNELIEGRYRLSLEYSLFDEEIEEINKQKIGTVFWLGD